MMDFPLGLNEHRYGCGLWMGRSYVIHSLLLLLLDTNVSLFPDGHTVLVTSAGRGQPVR